MSKYQFSDYSLLFLRLMVVFIFLYHGIPKAVNWTLAMQKFVDMGFPGFLGPITGIVEVITSLLILLGLYFKTSNLLLICIMAGAIAGVHIPASLAAGNVTAGLERDLMVLAGLLVLVAFGSGVWSLAPSQSGLKNQS